MIPIRTYQYVLGNLFTLLSTWSSFNNIRTSSHGGGVAQMVERSLSMREVPGSIPGASRTFPIFMFSRISKTKIASSGNRTRAARVAGEHSTTEPTMHWIFSKTKRFRVNQTM